ncbi:hypothetical protein I5907_01660 [Panacibacter sp. DH6]|uniref:YCII-related domain-containing protein n=1 Tax=Panacibacter microcysteis TaxID=2793269 RepID=A0A931DZZ8_9BACT|nr:YciI family protein [Panacibacter microcysteis]MBG9374925.1 hypothetical protein [Panacibacter microcysteis]
MKRLIILLTCLLYLANTNAQSTNPLYDSSLAKSLGADEYGMKMYVLVMLKTGPATIDNKATVDSLFGGHMQNIGRLAKENKLVVAGPLAKNNKNYRGIFILNVDTIEKAKALIDTDPAVHAGLLDADLFGWYGSAALPVYLKTHEKIEKQHP